MLRGRSGELAGTDSKQPYVRGGFRFGFGDDLLVARVGVFPGLRCSSG